MQVFVYKNGMCDQKAKLGGVKKFSTAEQVDGFLKALCGAMNPLGHRQSQVFIANDEVEQHEIDHLILMGDNYGLDFRPTSIKEVDTLAMAAENDSRMSSILDATGRRIPMVRAT